MACQAFNFVKRYLSDIIAPVRYLIQIALKHKGAEMLQNLKFYYPLWIHIGILGAVIYLISSQLPENDMNGLICVGPIFACILKWYRLTLLKQTDTKIGNNHIETIMTTVGVIVLTVAILTNKFLDVKYLLMYQSLALMYVIIYIMSERHLDGKMGKDITITLVILSILVFSNYYTDELTDLSEKLTRRIFVVPSLLLVISAAGKKAVFEFLTLFWNEFILNKKR